MTSPLTDQFGKYLFFVTALSVAATFLFLKLVKQEDANLNKNMFQVAFMTVAANLLVYACMTRGANQILTEPFYG